MFCQAAVWPVVEWGVAGSGGDFSDAARRFSFWSLDRRLSARLVVGLRTLDRPAERSSTANGGS